MHTLFTSLNNCTSNKKRSNLARIRLSPGIIIYGQLQLVYAQPQPSSQIIDYFLTDHCSFRLFHAAIKSDRECPGGRIV